MKTISLVVALTLLALVGCSGESACERYGRIGVAADADDQSASPEQVAEAAKAQVDCFAEESEQE